MNHEDHEFSGSCPICGQKYCGREIERLRDDERRYREWTDEIKGGIDSLKADNERLRTALNTARNYIEDEPMVANAVVIREGETVNRDTISAGKHPTLLQVIDKALAVNEQNVETPK